MKNSKRNLARRQRESAARLDSRWQPVTKNPVLSAGNVRYEVAERTSAICWGGLGMLQVVAKRLGLSETIDEMLHLLKRHKPYHESDHVMSLVYNVLSGGRCLEDLDLRRRDPVFLDALGAHRLPDPTTSGDFLRRFGEGDVKALMGAVQRVRAGVWRARPKAERKLALIDVDGTIVETQGRTKEKQAVSYDNRWGFGPLVVSLANTQEVLYVVNRPANRPSHDGAAAWMTQAAKEARDEMGFEKVRLRGDTDFSLTGHFDEWTDAGIEFDFGIDRHPSFVARAKRIEQWEPLERPQPVRRGKTRRRAPNVRAQVVEEKGYRDLKLEREHVAELEYKPRKCKKVYRMIVLRKTIRVTTGQLRLEDEVRYHFYVTNLPAEQFSAADVVRENNARCNQENLIEQLKNGVAATRMPVREFHANWAYLVIAALAWNLKAWSGLLLPEDLGGRALIRMEFRRFLNEVVQQPAQILRTGRRLVFRLLSANRWTELLLEGTNWLKRWQCASA